ncbi:hypothetical protein C5Z02_16230 [Bacteroides ovatus]|nr:hypothetical protein C5Z02_16230 [Bacteroides ovatus]
MGSGNARLRNSTAMVPIWDALASSLAHNKSIFDFIKSHFDFKELNAKAIMLDVRYEHILILKSDRNCDLFSIFSWRYHTYPMQWSQLPGFDTLINCLKCPSNGKFGLWLNKR